MVLAAEFFASLRGLHGSDERMTDEFCGNARASEECFFERKNAKCLREAAADDSNTPWSPSPELWTDVINIADSVRAEFPRETEMKTRKIGKTETSE
jgi:hypothetical protein